MMQVQLLVFHLKNALFLSCVSISPASTVFSLHRCRGYILVSYVSFSFMSEFLHKTFMKVLVNFPYLKLMQTVHIGFRNTSQY